MSPNKKSQKFLGKIKILVWAIFPVVAGISIVWFVTFIFNNVSFARIWEGRDSKAAVTESLTSSETKETISELKSQYFYINEDTNGQPKVSAKAFLVGDLNTGEVILAKNQNAKYPIASMSKLMTALVTSLIVTPDDVTEISKKAIATEGTNGQFRVGQKIKTTDLIYPLLLESSNDAAEALAEHFTREEFIRKMNQEAEILKMSQTSYDDPSGLSSKNQSTVEDMFKLVGYLNKQKKDVLSITGLRSYSNKKQSWSNISQFLNQDGYVGGKSGYTYPAKQTVVSIFNLPLGKTGVRPIAITLLQSEDKKDVETILKYLEKNIYYGGEEDANRDWIQQKIGVPEVKDPNFLILTFGGDIMLDRGVKNSVRKNFNNDYAKLFEKPELINILKKSDIVFANLEGTASDQGTDLKDLYSFRMDPSVVPALKGAGISVLSVANNHIGDWGRPAYVDTLARLKENEILYTGGGIDKKEAETPVIIEKYGIKIGFIGFSDKGPNYMAAGIDQAGQLLASDPRFDEIVKNASKQVDYLVVSLHFGEEYEAKHDARQEYLAHKAVDDGAKLVIGHHPHVVEETEVYSRPGCTQSSCASFIVYSLGNFIFDQSWSAPTMQGMLLEVKLDRDGAISVKKNIVKLNSAFQPDEIIKGAEEKLKFEEAKI